MYGKCVKLIIIVINNRKSIITYLLKYNLNCTFSISGKTTLETFFLFAKWLCNKSIYEESLLLSKKPPLLRRNSPEHLFWNKIKITYFERLLEPSNLFLGPFPNKTRNSMVLSRVLTDRCHPCEGKKHNVPSLVPIPFLAIGFSNLVNIHDH